MKQQQVGAGGERLVEVGPTVSLPAELLAFVVDDRQEARGVVSAVPFQGLPISLARSFVDETMEAELGAW
jgi:hypothetical protein